ncbi:MAG: RNA-binding transcriptional accessory protein [Myxococcales bacterium]|nr:RNA-binding transcriptional accessory protein [Myxococcales bacterium]
MSNSRASNDREDTEQEIAERIAREFGGNLQGVRGALRLLSEGATVPFIARYRKESTHGLDEVSLRQIGERARYLRELAERLASIKQSIAAQGKLSPTLERQLDSCATKAELEDLYAPFKPKRRTRGEIAKERGLEPLANEIWACALGERASEESPAARASRFVDSERDVVDVASALQGARDICAERIADRPRARALVRSAVERGDVKVKKSSKHRQSRTKFDDYDGFAEPAHRIPSHRLLAIFRGESEGVLKATLGYDEARTREGLLRELRLRGNSAWTRLLEDALDDALNRLLVAAARSDVRALLRERAEREAIEVFARNLEKLLLAAPFGEHWVLAIDPGQRTGCKCVVLDPTGKLIRTAVINLVNGPRAEEHARRTLHELWTQSPIAAVAVGNGTHGRETEDFVREQLKADASNIPVVSVNESGASVYSASDTAREELPDEDVTIRGAVSIGRRLQDPLAELVKIDPQSIGVGQYQHDVNQSLLAQKLGEVVESCVNHVGVELNTASPALLAFVSGIGPKLAKKIVAHRAAKGAFTSRKALMNVPGLGAKTFELAAGFLRVRASKHPLDGSAVHPERYELVERMAGDLRVDLRALVGHGDVTRKIDSARYLTGDVGEYTLEQILSELAKPGRDPRASFEAPRFRDDVRTLEDLREGMVLEGRVTNVTAFGAFVDVGVHQDGLVHISALADRFVKDPNEIVGVGDPIRVKVLAVDLPRKRISLSARGLG